MIQSDLREFDPAWCTAVPDWKERIEEGLSLIPDLPLFDEVAEKALRIFKRLKVPDLIGTPTYGEVCDDWVFDFVRVIFGSYNPETKKRMIREFFLLVPKKNGKSAIAAAIIVVAIIMNERPEAELVLIAPTQEISKIAFKQAKGMIIADAYLAKLFHIKEGDLEISHRTTGAVIKILSADGDVVTGIKATFILVDETHVLAAKAKAKGIFLELRGGLASRPEGFILQITTQSKTKPVGQFKKELDKARAVRDGLMLLPVLAVLYELPPEMAKEEAWRDPKTWGFVNPNLGVSVQLDYLLDQFETAKNDGPDDLALFASQHLNVEIGQGLTQDRWAGALLWSDAASDTMTFEEFLELCEVVVCGVDGGGMDDLLGLTFVGRLIGGSGWVSWSRAWVHKIALQRRKSIASELQDLAEAGELVICDYPTQDIDEIVELVSAVKEKNLLPEKNAIGLDPEGVAQIIDALTGAGIGEDQLRAVSQGYRLNAPIKGTERKLFDGSLIHADQALMDWCVSNAKTEQRGNAVMVTKAASGTAKIDPLMALFNGVHLMSLNPEAPDADKVANMNSYFQSLEDSGEAA
jgi:phage terminase large subunit-like protein